MSDDRAITLELFAQVRRARAQARELCRIARDQREFLVQQDAMSLAQRHHAIGDRRARLFTSEPDSRGR